MNELLEKEQEISIVPKNLQHANKGIIKQISDKHFEIEVLHKPEGIVIGHMIEFYSQTKNGVLFFSTSVSEIEGNTLTVSLPRKHRFLQRRAFTRIKFPQEIPCRLNDNSYTVNSVDLSAGGMKFYVKELLDINSEYDLGIKLFKGQEVRCKFEPIRIEKNDSNSYTVSGRFNDLSNIEKMTLIQFCMRKNMESINRKR